MTDDRYVFDADLEQMMLMLIRTDDTDADKEQMIVC